MENNNHSQLSSVRWTESAKRTEDTPRCWQTSALRRRPWTRRRGTANFLDAPTQPRSDPWSLLLKESAPRGSMKPHLFVCLFSSPVCGAVSHRHQLQDLTTTSSSCTVFLYTSPILPFFFFSGPLASLSRFIYGNLVVFFGRHTVRVPPISPPALFNTPTSNELHRSSKTTTPLILRGKQLCQDYGPDYMSRPSGSLVKAY